VLLCRRAINPRARFWTLPAGFLDMGETAEQGALREAIEEARATPVLGGILGVSSIPRIGQVQVIFRARLLDQAAIGPTDDLSEVALLAWDAIPWPELALPSVHWALDHWRESLNAPSWPARGDPGSA
jgi:ADP-ribose pyrophosphatase YjhB (NUDIX family)